MTAKKHNFVYRNSLTLVFLGLFIFSLTAQAITGWHENNNEIADKHGRELSFEQYLKSGHFISSTFENFESEFLQMGVYVLLTIFLRQKGSAESKSLDEQEDVDKEPEAKDDAPWPVKKGGLTKKIYENSLSLAFVLLFAISWCLHLYGSWQNKNFENALDHKPAETLGKFLGEPRFWFESFQNWQSEFLSVLSIVVLSIYLRQKGSPESKPVDAPHSETGK